MSPAQVHELLNDCIECSADLTEFLIRRKSNDAAARARAVGEAVDPGLERSGPQIPALSAATRSGLRVLRRGCKLSVRLWIPALSAAARRTQP